MERYSASVKILQKVLGFTYSLCSLYIWPFSSTWDPLTSLRPSRSGGLGWFALALGDAVYTFSYLLY